MWAKLIEFSVRNRLLVIGGAIGFLAWGMVVARDMPVDIYPDINDPRVTILTEAPGWSPEEVETLVTFPVEAALNGAPFVTKIRSSSGVGISVVFVEFAWGTDIFKARQLVSERLQLVSAALPVGVESPFMAPITSRLGEIIEFVLVSENRSVTPIDLRDEADWVLQFRLQSVAGVANVINQGGLVKQYHVEVDPARMAKFGIPLERIHEAIQEGNVNSAGGFFIRDSREALIRGLGRVHSLQDLRNIVVETRGDGVPLMVGDLAQVQVAGPVARRGAGSFNGRESVLGKITKQPGINTLDLSDRVLEAMEGLSATLPAGVKLVPVYLQGDVIRRAVATVEEALVEGAVIVMVVLALFLFNLRTSLISLTAIPLSLLLAIVVMRYLGLTLNTMTLAGLAISVGLVVDDAIIDVENIFRRLRQYRERPTGESPRQVVVRASNEIRSSVVYATLIILLVFIPLFTLEGIEGRFFAPLGLVVVVAMAASLVVALTVVPAQCDLLLARAGHLPERDSPVAAWTRRRYLPLLDFALRLRVVVVAVSALLILLTLLSFKFFGKEFLPVLDEGTFVVNAIMPPGTSLDESLRIGHRMERVLLQVPDVLNTSGRTGRAEQDEHAEGVYYNEILVNVKPKEERRRSREQILGDMRSQLAQFPGVTISIGQPIQHRLDHLLSGVNAQVAVKIYGEDLTVLRQKARDVSAVMAGVRGVADLAIEPQVDIPQLHVDVDREAAARYGLPVEHVTHLVEAAFNGEVPSQVLLGRRRYDIVLIANQQSRADLDAIRDLMVTTPSGALVPLSTLATVRRSVGPNTINRENVSRRIVVQSNVAGRDLGGFVEEVRDRVSSEVRFPPGYFVEYGGQFESQQRAFRRLLLESAFIVLGIFVLLYMGSGSAREALLIMLNLPFALVGGAAAVWLSGGVLSVPSLVGFILLFGIAVRNGIILVTHINGLRRREGLELVEAIRQGSSERVIPVLMTALAAGVGMLPLALASGSGAEIERPLAIVILGGMATSTVLTLLVLPVLYYFAARHEPSAPPSSLTPA